MGSCLATLGTSSMILCRLVLALLSSVSRGRSLAGATVASCGCFLIVVGKLRPPLNLVGYCSVTTPETSHETIIDSLRNTQGTSAYQPRIHKFKISFNPTLATTPSPPNLIFTYLDSVLFTDPSGNPISGLDPTTSLAFSGFPGLPATTFIGDGFGNVGPGGTRVSLDPEALVIGNDGFWISDEYGPFIYHFDGSGKMTKAIKPPPAIVPMRNGVERLAITVPNQFCPYLTPL